MMDGSPANTRRPMRCYKFGGTSMRHHLGEVVRHIVESGDTPLVVVVSALSGVTNDLLSGKVPEEWGPADQARARDAPTTEARVACGEEVAARTLAKRLQRCRVVVSHEGLITRLSDGYRVDASLLSEEVPNIVTGFAVRNEGGGVCLLGRNGSDTTATILAGAIGCPEVHIFTDVAGIFDVDPRLDLRARKIPELSVREASELAFHGASVLHSESLRHLPQNSVLWVRHVASASPSEGTRVCVDAAPSLLPSFSIAEKRGWKAVAVLRERVCVSVRSDDHINRSGFAARALALFHGANVEMISQTCSQTQIAVLVRREDLASVIQSLVGSGLSVERSEDLCVLTFVGENMCRMPGVASKIFSCLAGSCNVRMISQGASELSLSVAVRNADMSRALGAVMGGVIPP